MDNVFSLVFLQGFHSYDCGSETMQKVELEAKGQMQDKVPNFIIHRFDYNVYSSNTYYMYKAPSLFFRSYDCSC